MRSVCRGTKWLLICGSFIVLSQSKLLFARQCQAAVASSGYLESCQIMQLKKDQDFLSSKTGARLELTTESSQTKAFLSGDLFYEGITNDNENFNLREAYLDYQSGQWGFRIGRQIISWGKADGVRVTDVLCPTDYRDYFCYEASDTKKPVLAIKSQFQKNNMTAELVWMPFFEPCSYPETGNPWLSKTTGNLTAEELDGPERTLGNGEWFGRVVFNQSGFDHALTIFNCWWDSPVYQTAISDDTVYLQGRYYKVNGVGWEFSVPVNDLVWRGEMVLLNHRRFELASYSDYLERDVLHFLFGSDWYPGNNWTLMAQVADELILKCDSALMRERHAWVGTLKISKKLLRETLTLSNSLITALEDSDYYLKFTAEYAITDELHLSTGLLFFGGDNNGTFGRYKDKDGLLVKIRYSF
jgi:hypothetical protein